MKEKLKKKLDQFTPNVTRNFTINSNWKKQVKLYSMAKIIFKRCRDTFGNAQWAIILNSKLFFLQIQIKFQCTQLLCKFFHGQTILARREITTAM